MNFTKAKEHGLEDFTNGTFENSFPKAWEVLKRIPWRGPGCTGIIATDSTDGTVNHARNLDFTPVPFMTNLVYTGIFQKGWKRDHVCLKWSLDTHRSSPDTARVRTVTQSSVTRDTQTMKCRKQGDDRALVGWSSIERLDSSSDSHGTRGLRECCAGSL